MATIKFTGEEALGRVAEYVNKKLTFASSMPESPDTDTIVLYVGASNSSYAKGGIYQYDGTKWNLINLSQQVELTQEEYDELPEEVQNNGITYFITDANIPGSIVSGYYNEEDGLFYNEDTYDTEMATNINVLYIDVPTNTMYIYDMINEQYIQTGGNGGSNIVIEYVDILPPSDIKDIIYACRTTDEYQYVAAEGFLDNNDFFVKNDIVYTPNSNIQVKVTLNEEEPYKELFFIEYQNNNFKIFYKNGAEETLSLNEILYCQITFLTFYAGDAKNQKFIYISSTNLESILKNYYTKEEVNNLLDGLQPTTFNGRSGSIVSIAGDYNDSQIVLSSIMHIGGETQTTVAEALSALKNNSGGGSGSDVEHITISTKAEWDAMPQSQKDDPNIIYFLPWMNGDAIDVTYDDLTDKPSINNVILSGNKSLSDLGIQGSLTFDSTPTQNSNNPVTSGGVYTAIANALNGILTTSY